MMDAPLKFVPPGGYRACANCASAKAKCIQPDEGAGKCERCVFLVKARSAAPRACQYPSAGGGDGGRASDGC